MDLYNNTLQNIIGPDKKIMTSTKNKLDNLIKPIGSLGRLEDISIKVSGITGKIKNTIDKKCIIIMASDNGICEDGVSCSPKEITYEQTLNFTKGITGINILAKHASSDIKIIDIGIDSEINHPDIIDKKIRKGTSNISKGPAMSRFEAIKAIETGIEIVTSLVKEGYNLLGTGEMGIGNTSTSSAITMCLTQCSSDLAVGKGAGLTNEMFVHKKNIIDTAIKVNDPNRNDPIDVLSKLGGFDIAGLVGCYLGAAVNRVPILIDGLISAAAALVAYNINPLLRDYMIPSHKSTEPSYSLILQTIKLEPMLHLNMRLGEGTGCPLAFNIIEAALKITNEMASFQNISTDNGFLIDIDKNE
ncbi:MAG: nicotinate-nucleotide--dimethylbenzimidazole phosphoribosyltransferase [Clostridiales bacterium]